MSQPNVYLTLLIATDQAPADVQLAVLATLSDRYKIVTASCHSSGGDEDPMPEISFVVCPVRGLLKAYVDKPEEADALAKREGAVVIGWSADADHRGEVTA